MEYTVIVRDKARGLEKYIDEETKGRAVAEASRQAADASKAIYVSWTDSKGDSGYLNRNGDTKCPGEPW